MDGEVTILSLTAMALDEDGRPVDAGFSYTSVETISIQLSGHEIGRVPRDEVILRGGIWQIEESAADWLRRKFGG